jgi:hypothetical protein
MQRFRVHIEGRTFDGLWWLQPGYLDSYAAKLECPFDNCHQSYTSKNKRSGNDAQMTVKRFMKSHFNKKH